MATAQRPRPANSPEAPKPQPKNPEKRSLKNAILVGAGAGFIALLGATHYMAANDGYREGRSSRDTEVSNLHKLAQAQDWVIDNDITNVSKDNGIYEQGGNIYIRFEDKNCKAPVAFQYDEQQNTAVLNQTDQAGNIYASAKITNATGAAIALQDICS